MASVPYDVAEAFLRRRSRTRGSFVSRGDTIYSYGLRLAEWQDGIPLWTIDPEVARGYSATTSRHVLALRHVLPFDNNAP